MQNDIKRLIEKYDLSKSINIRIHDLSSEVGELHKAYLLSTNYGEKEFKLTPNFEEELGDILFTLLSISELTGLDASSLVESTISKYEDRFKQKGHIGSK
jgi:NTP pyrophosphatase (non-canonical NTP hydrolase)